MKERNIVTSVVGLVILLAVLTTAQSMNRDLKAAGPIELSVRVPEKSFFLGEVVPFEIRLENRDSQSVRLPHEAVEGIVLQVSTDNKSFRNYYGPGGGFVIDGAVPDIVLEPNEVLVREKTVLWNSRPKVSHLNSDAAKPLLAGRMLTDYAFPVSGIYFVRAVFKVGGGKSIEVESSPIEVKIEDPSEEEMELWHTIRTDGDIGYFIQEGDIRIPSYRTEEREKLKQKIERIVEEHPGSFYSQNLRQSLTKFNTTEEKRKALIEKAKIKSGT